MEKNTIEVYTSPTCHHCKTLKEYLEKHNIEYDERVVSGDEKLTNELVERSGQIGVPVTFVGDDVIVGFDEEKLAKALNISQ